MAREKARVVAARGAKAEAVDNRAAESMAVVFIVVVVDRYEAKRSKSWGFFLGCEKSWDTK